MVSTLQEPATTMTKSSRQGGPPAQQISRIVPGERLPVLPVNTYQSPIPMVSLEAYLERPPQNLNIDAMVQKKTPASVKRFVARAPEVPMPKGISQFSVESDTADRSPVAPAWTAPRQWTLKPKRSRKPPAKPVPALAASMMARAKAANEKPSDADGVSEDEYADDFEGDDDDGGEGKSNGNEGGKRKYGSRRCTKDVLLAEINPSVDVEGETKEERKGVVSALFEAKHEALSQRITIGSQTIAKQKTPSKLAPPKHLRKQVAARCRQQRDAPDAKRAAGSVKFPDDHRGSGDYTNYSWLENLSEGDEDAENESMDNEEEDAREGIQKLYDEFEHLGRKDPFSTTMRLEHGPFWRDPKDSLDALLASTSRLQAFEQEREKMRLAMTKKWNR